MHRSRCLSAIIDAPAVVSVVVVGRVIVVGGKYFEVQLVSGTKVHAQWVEHAMVSEADVGTYQ